MLSGINADDIEIISLNAVTERYSSTALQFDFTWEIMQLMLLHL